uniref:CooT family nickel-binding protein n=1 Tax=Mesocestoides corti TaxID=53468 RepID=A0A5K3G2Z1_MESCO
MVAGAVGCIGSFFKPDGVWNMEEGTAVLNSSRREMSSGSRLDNIRCKLIVVYVGRFNLRLVVEVKTLGELEVQLDGTALVTSSKSIKQDNVYFGTVEGTIALVQCPL